MAFCRCCFISTIPPGFSHTQRPVMVCGECEPHFGNPDKTALAHEKMMERLRASHAGAMERLDGRRQTLEHQLGEAQRQIQRLTETIVSDYRQRPIGDVQNVVEQAVVSDASRRADSAAKARDRVMGAVFRIDELHHEEGESCSCGKRVTECKEFVALGFIRDTYYRWENRQIDRLNEGKPHGLPLDHPKGKSFKGRRHEWKGLPSTVLQD
ncbi:MAG: hypothetical protein WED09_05505 [Homoserinimonas sp.]